MADPAVTPKPGEVPPPADPPKADPPAPPVAKVDPPKVDPPAPPAGPREIADEEDPKAGERVVLTTEALAKRMARSSKAQLRAEFGTDDPKVIKDKLERLATFEANAETARQAQLTKEQKAEEERTAALERATAAETRLAEVEENTSAAEADAQLKYALQDVVKPKFWKHIRSDLADFLVAEHGAALETMSDADREKIVKDWAAQYVKDNPEYAATATPPAKKDDPPPVVVPLTNGVANRGKKPAPVLTKFEGKTARPGQPNSMTPKEFAEWKRATGNNF